MHCPRCGVEQPQSDECIACGIIYTKYVESLGRERDTIPPTGASPPVATDTKPSVAPVVQSFQGPTAEQPGASVAQVPEAYAAQPLSPTITKPAGQHLGAQANPFAPVAVDPSEASPAPNPFTQTQEQPANPYEDTRTGPVLLPDSNDRDPFAPPIVTEDRATAPDLDPFEQPATRKEVPQVQVPTQIDPFAPPPEANPTQPVMGSAYPPASETPTLQSTGGVPSTVQMDPLSNASWEQQLESAVAAKSGAIAGNIHDLSTVPPETYAVSEPAATSISATGDANYQAMTAVDPLAPQQAQQQAVEQAPPQAAEPAPARTTTQTSERSPTPRSRFQRARPEEAESIHPVAAGARVLGAIACLAIAVLMMVNGRGLMSVMPYVIMVAYGCAALWGLTTYKGKITVRQFAIEMCVLVAVTLTLRTASPEMFSVESGQDEAPVRAVIKPHLPKNALGRYTGRALEVLTACEELAHPLPTTNAARVQTLLTRLDTQGLVEHYNLLPPDEQSRVDGIEKRVARHAPILSEAVLLHYKENGADTLFRPEGRKALDAERELSAALLRAQGLRARILVVPDGVTSESMRSTGD